MLNLNAFCEKFFGLHHEGLDNILTSYLSHRHTILKDHPHTTAERNTQLRIMSLPWTIYRTSHNGKVQRLFNMGQPTFNFSHNADKIVNVQASARRARNNRNTSCS